tara:strand:+ start:295 stop:615 length:321 start_codon:yes stop_codon:yes gene_type:complete
MNKFKKFILLNLILFLSSCGTLKDGFKNQKKNSSDEFLVEKKSPLVMPPNYNELPIPKTNKTTSNKQENKIETLIINTGNQDQNSDNTKDVDKTFKETLLEKIKNN